MPDRKEEILQRSLEGSISDSPSSDSYIARGLAVIVEGIEGTNGEVHDLNPAEVDVVTESPPKQLSAEVYRPKLVNVGRESSFVDAQQRVQTQVIKKTFRLGSLEIPPSSTGIKIVEFRAKSKAAKKNLGRKELALAA